MVLFISFQVLVWHVGNPFLVVEVLVGNSSFLSLSGLNFVFLSGFFLDVVDNSLVRIELFSVSNFFFSLGSNLGGDISFDSLFLDDLGLLSNSIELVGELL